MTDLKMKFRVVPEFDVSPLEALLAHLRAFTPPVEAVPVSVPVNLPKPVSARKKPTPAPAKARPAARRKPAVGSTKPARGAQEAGRDATCKLCEKTFRAKAHGKLPRYCRPCNAELHTPDKVETPS